MDMRSTIVAAIVPIVAIAIAAIGTGLRRSRRAKMTLEQRRGLEIVPSYRDRIR
jgi:formate hydrogenlyase subunit 4